jgi:hypothetical protein
MKIKMFKKSWEHRITGIDGNCILFGVNIFNYEWNDTGEKVTVIDPQYHKKHNINVYTVDIGGTTKRFAAGEFSNGVWGLFLEK